MKRALFLLCLALVALPLRAAGLSETTVKASAVIPSQDVTLLGPGITPLTGGSTLVVRRVEAMGDTTRLLLHGARGSARLAVKMPSRSAAGLAVGTQLSVAAEETGSALMIGKRLVAFIPNETGASLLRHSPAGSPTP